MQTREYTHRTFSKPYAEALREVAEANGCKAETSEIVVVGVRNYSVTFNATQPVIDHVVTEARKLERVKIHEGAPCLSC